MPSPEHRRRGFQFSLRSLLFLVTFLAILLGTYKTLGRYGAPSLIDDPWVDRLPRWLVGIGILVGWLVVPVSAAAVPVYVWMSRRSPSFLALFAAGAVAAAVLYWADPPGDLPERLREFGPYCLLTMLTGSLLALVECGIKRLPWRAVWVSCAALVCSLSYFCFLYVICQVGK